MRFRMIFTAEELSLVRDALKDAEHNADENFEGDAADTYGELAGKFAADGPVFVINDFEFGFLMQALASADSPLCARFDKTLTV